jgi:bifunctional DNA-binding transcriptional regulator/antitoxin component of YhaV-PrlF toxin-antitoxin module
MTINYVMKISSNGQVSIPAETRTRWQASQVLVVDLGDLIVMRPLPADPVGALRGKYRDRGLNSETARREARDEDALDDRR